MPRPRDPHPSKRLLSRTLRGLRRVGIAVGALTALAVSLAAPACQSLPTPRAVRGVDARASSAYEEARTWARRVPQPSASAAFEEDPSRASGAWEQGGGEGGGGATASLRDLRLSARERARHAAQLAVELEPDWVAPQRLLDNLDREDLLGLEALERRRARAAPGPDGRIDAGQTYLAGRLEGERGLARFEVALRADPDLAWAYHGVAIEAGSAGKTARALQYGRAALARARDESERSFFTASLASYMAANEDVKGALALLLRRLDDPGATPIDRIELGVQAALLELGMFFQPEHERGWQRAQELLRQSDLSEREIDSLVRRMRVFGPSDSSLELQLALASRKSPARDRWRAELMLEQRSTPLALGLLRRSRAQGGGWDAGGPLLRAARFAAGQFRFAVDEWLLGVPARARAADGLPADERLRALVLRARGMGEMPAAGELSALGEDLLAAGWFQEARSVAAALAEHDLDAALDLEDRAAAGLDLVLGVRRVLQGVDQRHRASAALASGAQRGDGAAASAAAPGPRSVDDLDGVLGAMAPLVARAQSLLGGELDAQRVERELLASPRLSYGPVGSLIHPGPRFSTEDQAAGRGRAGDPVPGLAALLARLGRFGIFGEVSGQGGPDGTILQRVRIDEGAGSHFGVPWHGTLALCEGADLLSRAGRRGAVISGAALHEGYWVDYDALRGERARWSALEREFRALGARERLLHILGTRGLTVQPDNGSVEAARAARRDVDTLLGEADRVRLAVLRDRLASAQPPAGGAAGLADEEGVDGEDVDGDSASGLVSLDELVEVTELHEQGHLCDRTRFLPIRSHLGAGFRFLLAVGFSPAAASARLEYRAELVALARARDPRVVLASILEAAEGGGNGVTPHAGAYRTLLADLMSTFDRDVDAHPERWPDVDRERVLVQQLHRLGPEQVRSLALLQARREGLR